MTDTADQPPPKEPPKIAFLGPAGTFGEEALRNLDIGEEYDTVPVRTMPDAIQAVEAGTVEYALIAIENSIEGTVNVSMDALIHDSQLYIQREIVSEINLCLLAPKGVKLKDIKRVVSFPVAIAECRNFLATKLPGVETVAANSTSEAARQVSKTTSTTTAAVGTRLAAEIYGLQILDDDISDHSGNQTRFVLLSKDRIPAPSGHDKTSIVVFQSDNKPGNLHAYLGQFSARNINLTKLESRPTKRGLGDYCFVIDLEGHVDSEVVADCLRDLHVQAGSVKFLGSYPAAGPHGPRRRRDALAAWRAADEWVSSLRGQVAPNPKRARRLKVVK